MKKNNHQSAFFKNFNKVYYTTDGYDDYLKRFKKEGKDYALALVKKLNPHSSWRFLDVGCGMGGLILGLRWLNFDAWGTEVSPFCLKHSPARKWMHFGNVCHLPFPDFSFEVVICMDILCYLNQKKVKKAIKELTRVAKKHLYIENICQGSPNSDQKKNPDWLRKDKLLISASNVTSLFEENGATFTTALFSQKKNVDFNGIFAK